MSSRIIAIFFALVVGAALGVCGVWTYPYWSGWLGGAAVAEPAEPVAAPAERVKISAQARANLGLRIGRMFPAKEPYWRSLTVPGQVVERQGNCDRLVTAPLAGVVQHIGPLRGEIVHAGDVLFTLRLTSEPLQTAQSELYKNRKELQIVKDEQQRLSELYKSGGLPVARLVELQNQQKRLTVQFEALQHELALRGLTSMQIESVAQGKFVTEVSIPAPAKDDAAPAKSKANDRDHEHAYELEDLKVKLGEQVQAGQALCLLADHQHVEIEGRAFVSETPLIQKAAREGRGVKVEFPRESDWPSFDAEPKITSLANTVEPQQQTLLFYLPLANQFHEYTRGGKVYRLWRFRPGQRVHLQVPVEAYAGVFVFPAEAVIREGPEALVFRENGDYFERTPVHVVYQDRRVALVAHDGSIVPGNSYAMNAAPQLNAALKAQAGGEQGRHHHH